MRASLTLGLAALLIVAGCSKDKSAEKPAKLVEFPTTLAVNKLWSVDVGGGKHQMLLRLGLGPCVDDGIVYAASHKGEVMAVRLDSGRTVWRKRLRLPLSGGPGAGFGIVVVGSSKGDVVALDSATGNEKWRTRVNSELLSAPAISAHVVVLRSVDGHLRGLDTATGKEIWSVEQQVPRLSLRGIATPVIAKEVVISGFDNGKVEAVNLKNGDTLWDATLGAPHGSTELARLVDVDAAVKVVGDNVYATGYHGRTAQIGLDSGQIWWAHDMSSDHGLAVDDQSVYVSEADGTVVALRARDGSVLWRNDQLKWRRLSAPVVTDTAVVVADYQGYVHWLDKGTGKFVARTRDSKYRVSNAPVAIADTVVILSDGGELAAFRAAARPAG